MFFTTVLSGFGFRQGTLSMRGCMYSLIFLPQLYEQALGSLVKSPVCIVCDEFDTTCKTLRTDGGTTSMSSDWMTSRFDTSRAVCCLTFHTFSDSSNKETMISFCSCSALAFFTSSKNRLVFQGCIQVSMATSYSYGA